MAVVFLLALILRLALLYVVISKGTCFYPDSFDYIRLAEDIARNHTYGTLNNPELFRVPLYPFLISGFILVFKAHFIPVLLIFQAFLDSLTALMVMKTANFLFKGKAENIGLISGMLYSLSPLCIVYSSRVLSETLFVFAFMLLIVLSTRLFEKNDSLSNLSFSYLALTGILAGALCLIRAVFLPVSVLFLLLIALRMKRIKYILVVITFYVLVIGWWSFRNYLVAGYVGVSTVSAVNMYRYDACSVLARIHSVSFAEQQSKIDVELSRILNSKEVSRYCTKMAFSVIKAHPVLYAWLDLRNSSNALLPSVNTIFDSFGIKSSGDGTLGVINSKGLLAGIKHYFGNRYVLLLAALPLTIALLICYGLTILGILMAEIKKMARQINLYHLFMLLSAVGFTFMGGAASTPRFRVPVEPFLCIYASAGIIFLREKLIRKRNGL